MVINLALRSPTALALEDVRHRFEMPAATVAASAGQEHCETGNQGH